MTKLRLFRSMSDSDKENIVKCHNENLQYALDNMNEFDMIVLDEILRHIIMIWLIRRV